MAKKITSKKIQTSTSQVYKKNLPPGQMLEVIFDYVGQIANKRTVEGILILMANMAREILVADRCTVWLLDHKKQQLWTKVAQGIGEIRIPWGTGLVGHAIKNNIDVMIKDAYKDDRFNSAVDKKTGYKTKSILVIPMRNNDGKIIGAFQAINKMTRRAVFTNKDLDHLRLASSYSSRSIESAFLYQEIIDTQKDVIFSMAEIGESRSKETGNHVKRVAEYSYILALECGLSDNESEVLKMASPMHDIGKVAIPDSILKKPGRLTKDEFEIMKTHSQLGYEMLKKSDREILKASAVVAGEHHEKYNGTGYPRGLKGEKIHIDGRITAIADVFDALSSDRIYKRAWPLEDVLDLFKKERGKHFEPKLVDILFKNIDKFNRIREDYSDVFDDDEIEKERNEREALF